MNRKKYWILAVLIMITFISCHNNETLNYKKDKALIEAIKSAQNQSDKGIDIETLEDCIKVYEKKGDKGKICLCNTFIGYKLYLKGDYDKSMIHLKKAEANLQYCDSASSFVYSMIVNNTLTTDSTLALHYAKKALEKNLEYNTLHRLPYSYLNISLLTKKDTAQIYLQKSLDLFDENKKIMAKAQFGKFHSYELNADSVIEYIKPYYEKINYVGYARTLIEAYIDKGMLDNTEQYIQHLASRKDFENDYFYSKAKIMTSLGKYDEGCKWWEQAYICNEKEWRFITNQRLGAINAEYDLLHEELENQKEKSRIKGIYNTVLLVMIIIMIITFVAIERYKKYVNNLQHNVIFLKSNVNDLEKEVNNLEIEIEKRKKKFTELFEEYKCVYKAHKETIYTEANKNIAELHKAYPKLTNTDITIIWLIFMDYTRDLICEILNISTNYYYQRKSIIHRTLNITTREGEASRKMIVKIVRQYITDTKNEKEN